MYKKKCLFRNSNATFGREASAIESVWAYINGIEAKKTGRYRIRITKMSAQELVAMGLAPEETPTEFYGLQASLDKWQEQHGWLPLFDWVGDPNADIFEIERDLGKQFQSFMTGLGIEDTFGFDLPKPPPPPKDPEVKKRPFKIPAPDVGADAPKDASVPKEKDDDPDFEWL